MIEVKNVWCVLTVFRITLINTSVSEKRKNFISKKMFVLIEIDVNKVENVYSENVRDCVHYFSEVNRIKCTFLDENEFQEKELCAN